MLSTKEAERILEDSGFEVVKTTDTDFPGINKVYLGTEIVWDKLILGMKSVDLPQFQEGLKSIPHFKWIHQILLKENLKMAIIEIETEKGPKQAYGFKFDRIYNSPPEKYKRLNKVFSFFFYLVRVYMEPLLEPFEANDKRYNIRKKNRNKKRRK